MAIVLSLTGWERIKGPFVGGRPVAEECNSLRREVFERDDYTCRYCGQRGGKLAKGNNLISEWSRA